MNTQKTFILVLLLSILFFACAKTKTSKKIFIQERQISDAMNKIDPYWKEIDSLLENGLPKSALKKLEEIEAEIRKSNHPGQLVKWVKTKVSTLQYIETDSNWKNYTRFQTEIEKAETPAKEVLAFYLAQYLQNWTQNNRWRIRQRTAVAESKTADLRTWSLAKLEQETHAFYQIAIANQDLKNYPTAVIEPNIIHGSGTAGLRPTLFDLLAHQVLRFYTQENNFLTEPAYKFYIDQPVFFADAKTFYDKEIITKDTRSRKYVALNIFKDLIRDRMQDGNADGLVDLELLRLTFVYQNYVGDRKDELYLNALNSLREKYTDSPITAETILKIASFYHQKASEGNSKDANQKAVSLLKEAILNYPKTYGAERSESLLNGITGKKLDVQIEDVYLPNTAGLIKVEYANIKSVELTIFKLEDPFSIFQLTREEHWKKKLSDQPVAYKKSYFFTSNEDYNKHSTELLMPELKAGQYYARVTDQEGKVAAYLPFQVSSFAVLKMEETIPGSVFKVLDRKSGLPVVGATLNVFTQLNYSKPRYSLPKKFTVQADGQVHVKFQKNNFNITISNEKDLLILERRMYDGRHRTTKIKKSIHTHFFLDRAIYRPGQTVYFKALVLEKDEDRIPHIEQQKRIEITLFDANRQKVKSFNFTTNEYGTINGHFKLPQGGMNGSFSIASDKGGSQYFRVEDYKRPRFEVMMDSPKKAFSLGEKVTVSGTAKNYSGSPLDGAKVKYVVNRQTSYPYWKRHWGAWFRPQAPSQVAVGEAITKPDGTFEVVFDALPDRNEDKKGKPNFTFNINVTVVDVTGEVHEAQSNVVVGYIALSVNVPLSAKSKASDFGKIPIVTQNLNGQFEPAKGTVKVSRLKSPDQFFVARYWSKPDYQLLSKPVFNTSLPLFAYGVEDEMDSWRVERVILETNFNTKKSDSVDVDKGLLPGFYKIEVVTQDKNGEKIEIVKYVELQGGTIGNTTPKLFGVTELKMKSEPGEFTKVRLASAGNVHYIVSTLRYKKAMKEETHAINNTQKTISFAVTEMDRGGFKASVVAVNNNRFFIEDLFFSVPWSQKELKITYESFREKLYPGQKEKWRVKISGPKAASVTAEVVAGLYDASLDAFVQHSWDNNFYPSRYLRGGWDALGTFNSKYASDVYTKQILYAIHKRYDAFTRLDLNNYGRVIMRSAAEGMALESLKVDEIQSVPAAKRAPQKPNDGGYKTDSIKNIDVESKGNQKSISPRINLNETVFFKPDLKTDKEGNFIIEFTMNEALTKWKLMLFAHDKEMRTAYSENEVITQKEIMVIPNPPRFLREFDEVEFSAKVVNMSEKDLRTNVELQLLDDLNMLPVYKWLDNPQFNKVINLSKGRSEAVSFRFKVPSVGETALIRWTLTASANTYSDAESSYFPVVSNRMLVTETLPLSVKPEQSKIFTFTEMDKSKGSKTIDNHRFTLEFTANPAWYAVQALPYMMEYPHECSEQIFSRLYANTLASSIANKHPKIKQVFEKWRMVDTEALVSNLSKNQELKSALLEETPWVLNALSEEEQKKNIALLFDLDRMAGERNKAIRILAERQSSNGGFSWFPGGKDSWYITQYLVEGFGHLRKLEAMKKKDADPAWNIINKSIKYIDSELLAHYKNLEEQIKNGHTKWEDDHLDNNVIHFLYARSFFLDQDISGKLSKPYNYYLEQAKRHWLGKGLYLEGMLALGLHRNGRTEAAKVIMKSIKERSIVNDELGMYWKLNTGFNWYQLPVETNALMIEAFNDVMDDKESVYQLKIWLLKNKQTTHWRTTKATASAVYALLSSGDNWLLEDQPISIKLGGLVVQPDKTEAGTGYFKQSWTKEEMTNSFREIKIDNPNKAIAWGAAYWQYFEDLDKVTIFEDTPLKLKKELFIETLSDRGIILKKVNEGAVINVGDKLKMRIELRVDRAMEYVHMKDMRASSFEPSNVLSQYKWQDGLGYYESTRDLATDFFFSYLQPGVYVFEYPLTAQLRGNYSNGVTTIQCMYAPEFTSHTDGIRVKVE